MVARSVVPALLLSLPLAPALTTRRMPVTPAKRKATSEPSTARTTKMISSVKGSFGCAMDDSVEVHTLILGTQPSDVSLEGNRYYDTHTNALWHIVGDALGWRRGWLDSKGRGPAPSITRSLLHEETVESYDEALRRLTSRGYALWDVLKQSERAGSLDGDIKNAQPADVRALVERHPSISRICFASGGTTAGFFKRHFKEWLLEEGAFRLADDPTTRGFAWPKARPRKAAVAAAVAASEAEEAVAEAEEAEEAEVATAPSPPPLAGARAPIELVIMESVSPAYVPRPSYGDKQAAKRAKAYSEAGYPHHTRRASAYAWKRQQWFDACFQRELSPESRSKRFGDREGDFVDDTDDYSPPQPVD